jgi:hypothetical protein
MTFDLCKNTSCVIISKSPRGENIIDKPINTMFFPEFLSSSIFNKQSHTMYGIKIKMVFMGDQNKWVGNLLNSNNEYKIEI